MTVLIPTFSVLAVSRTPPAVEGHLNELRLDAGFSCFMGIGQPDNMSGTESARVGKSYDHGDKLRLSE